jgi:hypothetical protein
MVWSKEYGELMALSDVITIFNKVTNAIHGGFQGASSVFAWIGVILIAMVLLYYAVYGIVKMIKLFLNLKIKYLGMIIFMLGIVFIVLAMILP